MLHRKLLRLPSPLHHRRRACRNQFDPRHRARKLQFHPGTDIAQALACRTGALAGSLAHHARPCQGWRPSGTRWPLYDRLDWPRLRRLQAWSRKPMRAMILEHPGEPLKEVELPLPEPASGQVRVRVAACGVCRTDLHVVDGDLEEPKLPVIPGHEIVGYVDAVSPGATPLRLGGRVGIPWLGHTCGVCPCCR